MTDMPKILICDDDEDILSLLQLQLGRAGFEVLLAQNGLQAVEKARSETPHIAVLDWMMPVMDGVQACRQIRQENKHIYIIMLSAIDSDEQKAAALEAGANDYRSKPMMGKQLVILLNQILERPY